MTKYFVNRSLSRSIHITTEPLTGAPVSPVPVAVFTDSDDGKKVFSQWLGAVASDGKSTVFDEDRNQYLVGDVGQLVGA